MNELIHPISWFKGGIKEHLSKKLIGLLLVIVVVLYILSLIPVKVAYANHSISQKQIYKTIEIKSGDSLWSIAKEHYSKEYQSIPQYIELIKKCNSLRDEKIQAGCYLVVPYYDTQE